MDKKSLWLMEAYTLVAENGMSKMNIESLANKVGSSKSSFYHFYGDAENFTAALLKYHIQRSEELAVKISVCDNLRPDMLRVFIENQEDILFHKQIRIKREDEICKTCFEAAYKKVERAIFDKWIIHLGLSNQALFAKAFLNLVADNFLLRITKKDFTYSWLENYIQEISYLITQIDSTNSP